MSKKPKSLLLSLAALCTALWWPAAAGGAEGGAPRVTPKASAPARVIVKYRDSSALMRAQAQGQRPALARHADTMGRRLGLALVDGHDLGPRTQSLHARGISAEALARRLAAQPDVEWAEPVRRRYAHGVVPNDPYYAGAPAGATPVVGQWYLRAPNAVEEAAIDAVGAWALTTGSPSVAVAVLDTGVRPEHPDLAGKLLPGYDFIGLHADEPAYYTANDGNGVDDNPSDPGDWVSDTQYCDSTSSSSWHGTQTAGIVGAAADNGVGISGVARDVKVLPVRVLGRCGGYDDDIQAGMRWAAGIHDSIPNPNRAQVINMSLGGEGACLQSYAQTVAAVMAAGVTVVASAGNEGKSVGVPANCPGVIAVAGVRHTGTKVGYSSLGPEATIAAPAGNCVNNIDANPPEPCLYPIVTTSNAGRTTPGASTYTSSFGDFSIGTSFASPQVAGVVALMLSMDSTLTPARIRSVLAATARPFPVTDNIAACRPPTASVQPECYCTTGTCGAGLLDARRAVATVAPGGLMPPVLTVRSSMASPPVGTTVTLTLNAVTEGGRTLDSRGWFIAAGAGRAALVGPTDGTTATLVVSAPGDITVRAIAIDTGGAPATTSITLYAQAAGAEESPPSDGGGGGALSALFVGLVALAVAVLYARLRQRPNR